MAYEILIKPSAVKEIEKLSRDVRAAIGEKIDRLSETPRPSGCAKLKGEDLYRVRAGGYRIVYQIQDKKLVVLVVRVGDRRDVYRKLK